MPSIARRVAEGSSLLFSRNLLQKVIGVAITITLVRYLGKYEYGLYALFTSATGIAAMFLVGALKSVIVADAAQELQKGEEGRAKTLLFRYSQFILGMSILISIAIFFLSFPVSKWYSAIVGDLVIIIAFIIPSYALRNILVTTFQAHSRFDYMALIGMLEAFFRLAFVIVAVVILDYGLMGAAYSQLFGPLMAVVLVLPFAFSTVEYLKKVPRAKVGLFYSTMKGHGKYIVAMVPFNQLREKSLPWIVQFFVGVEAVAIFTVAKRGMQFFQNLLNSISQVYIPMLSEELRGGAQRVNKIMNRSIKYVLALSIPVVLAGILIAPLLFELLFETRYLESVPVFRVIVLTLLVVSIRAIMGPVFMAYKAQRYSFFASVFSLFSTLLMVSILTPPFGLLGAAGGYLLGVAVFVLTLWYYMGRIDRELRLEIRPLLTLDDYDKRLIRKVYRRIRRRIT